MSTGDRAELTHHAQNMLEERNIDEAWLWRTIEMPDEKFLGTDGNTHFIKAIDEFDRRILRVIVNTNVTPARIVTVFFDRRLRRK